MSLILGGNWCIVLQDSKKIRYLVGWLACTISITLVSKRPIIYNLVEIVVLEPFADSISLPFESTCLLDNKRIKRKRKKRHYLSCFLNSNEQKMLVWFLPTPFPNHPHHDGSQGSKKIICLRIFTVLDSWTSAILTKQPTDAVTKNLPGTANLALAYVWWQYSVFQDKHVPEIGL